MKLDRDTAMMDRCINLALEGVLKVSPNPMVGCVIVQDGRIVGEGYHRTFGGPHAEVEALRKAGRKARGSTLYVNLEPCAHFGKTPPCADAIIAAGVREVVIAAQDPNPLVRGRGIRRLRAGGVRVRTGILRREAEILNERFFTFMKRGTPFVAVKLAMTLDGRIADSRGRSKWITSPAARTLSHELRAEHDAVLVGAATVLKDNPSLTVRHVRGRNPIRVVVDGMLRVPETSAVIDTRDAETILVTSTFAARSSAKRLRRIAARGVRIVLAGTAPRLDPRRILQKLAAAGITSILVEGGAATAGHFFARRCVDRVHAFIAPQLLGEGKTGIAFPNTAGLSRRILLEDTITLDVGPDLYLTGRLKW